MGPVVTIIFLILLSGTITSQYPSYWCNILKYKDVLITNPQTGYYSFQNEANFDHLSVYIYDNSNKRAVPQPRWQNVENWDELSQLQKEREDLIIKDLQETITSNEGTFKFIQIFSCELCPNGVLRISKDFQIDGKKFIKTNKNIPALALQDPAAEIIKQQSSQEQGAMDQVRGHLEIQCRATLQKYKNYITSN
ncbi:zinc-alpha-2-glycoprotein-like [Gracilinanus agilis]|uniref:zinc-alpha-2-glycoprotein-like n=1 Tax=Gracilinanus agilis TaxID=191870 RepID=UPI001CFEF521|nr:zinc-alpha-2-glycoprotein-like [Gracilinanus agilis]